MTVITTNSSESGKVTSQSFLFQAEEIGNILGQVDTKLLPDKTLTEVSFIASFDSVKKNKPKLFLAERWEAQNDSCWCFLAAGLVPNSHAEVPTSAQSGRDPDTQLQHPHDGKFNTISVLVVHVPVCYPAPRTRSSQFSVRGDCGCVLRHDSGFERWTSQLRRHRIAFRCPWQRNQHDCGIE